MKIKIIFAITICIAILASSITICKAENIVPGGNVSSNEDLFNVLGGSDTCILNDNNVFLCSDITLSSSVIISSGNITLDAGGCEIKFENNSDSFIVEGTANFSIGSQKSSTSNDSVIISGNNRTGSPLIKITSADSSVTVYAGVKIINNVSDSNGGAVYNEGAFTLRNGIIDNCRSMADGGAIYSTGNVILLGGYITNCSAERGGTLYAANGSNTLLSGTEIKKSNASKGGAIFNSGVFEITSSCISASNAQEGGCFYNCGTLKLSGGQINTCTASYAGGAIFNEGELTCSGTYISDTTADDSGGCLYNTGSALIIKGSLTGGTAKLGGNAYNVGTFSVEGGSLSDGTATYGGAIFNDGILSVSGGSFSVCKAEIGKAIFNNGKLSFNGYPYIDPGVDVFIVKSENNEHIPSIDSEMKAEHICTFTLGTYNLGIPNIDYSEGDLVIVGDYVKDSYIKFKISPIGTKKYTVSSDGTIKAQKKITEQLILYVAILFVYLLIIFLTVLFARKKDKKNDKK